MILPQYTFSTALTEWTFNLPVSVVLAAVLVVYLLGARAAGRRGVTWPLWRTVSFAVLGLGFVAFCTMSSLAVYDHTYLWALAAQLTLLLSLAPVGIALGDPIGLTRAALPPDRRAGLDRALASAPVRALTFPTVSAVLATVAIMVIFFSPILGSAVRSDAVLDLVYVVVLVVGCLAALPLLGAEILPDWCTEPLKMLFAFADGLLDAIPGILLMTTSAHLAGGYFAHGTDPNSDVHIAGALMLALTEAVTLPMFFILFFTWAAHETRRDREHRRATAPGQPVAAEEPESTRPWWETEGLGPRNRRIG